MVVGLSALASRPWLIVSLTFGVVKSWQQIKGYANIGGMYLTGQVTEANCKVCNIVTDKLLAEFQLKDMRGGGINCKHLCWGLGKPCRKVCDGVIGTLKNSSAYPCEAMGACPSMENADCTFSVKSLGCTPRTHCTFHFPNKCELNAGQKMWKQTTQMATQGYQTLGVAFHQKAKFCDEDGAGPHCKMRAAGLGAACQWAGFALLAYASVATLRAIKTPSGGDDRQMLTFWVAIFAMSFAERFTDVLLSSAPRYYEIKLLLLLWLLFDRGADKAYRRGRRFLAKSWCMRKLLTTVATEPTTEQVVAALPLVMQPDAKACAAGKGAPPASLTQQAGKAISAINPINAITSSSAAPPAPSSAFSHTSATAFLERFGSDAAILYSRVVNKLWRQWTLNDPRYLTLELKSATNLPMTAGEDVPDAYVVASLVPPRPPNAAAGAKGAAPVAQRRPTVWGALKDAVRALCKLRLPLAASRLYRAWRLLTRKAKAIERREGPLGPPGQYGHVSSGTVSNSHAPVWDQEIEFHLQGGEVNEQGEYDNDAAPYTKLRLEVWDYDTLAPDDFLGEVTVALTPLMDLKTHEYQVRLMDPEGKVTQAKLPPNASISFALQYEA